MTNHLIPLDLPARPRLLRHPLYDPPARLPVGLPPAEETQTEQRLRYLTLLQRCLNAMGNPERACPVVHVTGTNGKGSTSQLIASILWASGANIGHQSASGQMALSNFPLPRELGAAAQDKAGPTLVPFLKRSAPNRVIADDVFQEVLEHIVFADLEAKAGVKVDARVVEVNSGGASDLSNVVQPAVSVLTNVTLDHTDLFGDTVEEIANEKAGIIKAGAPAVTAETNPAVLEVFRRRAEEVGTELHVLDRSRVLESSTSLSGTTLRLETDTWGDLELQSSLVGLHQIDNIALAVRAVELLPANLRPGAEHVAIGVANTRWPGRFQVLGFARRTVIVDGAHNEASAKALAATLEAVDAPRPRVALLACLARKDTAAIVREVSHVVDRLVLSPIGRPLIDPGWDPADAAAHAKCEVEAAPSFPYAVMHAMQLAGEGGAVIIAGSLYTAQDALAILFGLTFH